MNFLPNKLIFDVEMPAVEIIMIIIAAVFLFLSMSLLAILIRYISTLHERMKTYNLANIKLLDGMHEGLLIISKSDNKVIFCNRPS